MDFAAVLTEIRSWPAEERIRLIGEVWDELSDDESSGECPEEVKRFLDDRIAALERNPEAVVPWEEVEARALDRFRE